MVYIARERQIYYLLLEHVFLLDMLIDLQNYDTYVLWPLNRKNNDERLAARSRSNTSPSGYLALRGDIMQTIQEAGTWLGN